MRILTVYNICGIHGDKTDWYIKCIESIFHQTHQDQVVVVSSCKNSKTCLSQLKSAFKHRTLEIVSFEDPYIVNVTFNKTVQEMVKKYGEFDGYFFLDSGVMLDDLSALSEMVKRLETNKYSMVGLQTDTDTGYEVIGYRQDCPFPQITETDFVIPLGKAVNLHAQLFSNDIYNRFDEKIIPDVFAAFCTESTFPFLNAAVGKKWVIVKDFLVHHNKAVDGPSSSQPHFSPVHHTPWNNLLYGRNALDFITDPDAIKVGLGYEECGKIMMHNPKAYDENENALYPQDLGDTILQYFYSNKQELDYDKIKVNHE